jgi:hypothetical protein
VQPNERKIWFPAKRYGWGWGFPCCWQGWLVMLGWIVLVSGAAFLFLPEHQVIFFTSEFVLVAVLIAICFIKGEKPRWRWGDK